MKENIFPDTGKVLHLPKKSAQNYINKYEHVLFHVLNTYLSELCKPR